MRYVGSLQVVELDDGTQVMEMVTCDDDQGSNLENTKEKNKIGLKAKVYLLVPFLFHQSRHYRECDWV